MRAQMTTTGPADLMLNIHNAKNVYNYWATNANTTLKKDDAEAIMAGVKELQELNLVAVEDLRSFGLTTPADLTSQVLTKTNLAGDWDAEQSMNVVALDDNQTEFGLTSTPIPLTHCTFHVPFRQTGFDYKMELGRTPAMRAVMKKINTTTVNGNTSIVVYINGAAYQLYGYTNHPNRTTRTISDWTAATTNLLTDCADLVCDFRITNKISVPNGGLMFYYANNLCATFKGTAFAAKGDNSFEKQVLADNPEIGAMKPLTDLADDEVVLVAMLPEYIQLASAQAPTVAPHQTVSPLSPDRFTAWAAEALVVHVDNAGLTGIVHGGPAQ